MDKRIPKFLVEEDIIHLKISCRTHRERALLEFLYSTGCRIGEVEKLNIEDLNWENCSAIVNGKGYSCKALFVTDTKPIKRMAIPTLRWALKIAERSRQMYTPIAFVIPTLANS
ncbi:tyrosine-type recombinase/integrase [Paenibacillus silviterrae]|uniref:tyrosine-type recombinase/integrase n=1 Tax=Paenibacillus silviterrae TaxID=3242194 RepID=UPI0025432003|nr:tyrosine-type recombinase/integrase [Paenibacillus chinjuensis]